MKMKLSDAIAKGSKGRTQGFNTLRNKYGDVCVLGAACYGVGITPKVNANFSRKLENKFPVLLTRNKVKVKGEAYNLQSIITRKNDDHRWGFKRIINWLRKLGL